MPNRFVMVYEENVLFIVILYQKKKKKAFQWSHLISPYAQGTHHHNHKGQRAL